MNLNLVISETLFEFAHRDSRNGRAIHDEKGGVGNELLDLAEICRVVGRDSHRSIRAKRAIHGGEEVF